VTCRLPLVAAVAATVAVSSAAVSSAKIVQWPADPDRRVTRPEDRKQRGRTTHYARVAYVARSLGQVHGMLLMTVIGC
jgi:hypothetical protein